MSNMLIFLGYMLGVGLASQVTVFTISYLLMISLLCIYMLKQFSLMNLMILLEMMVLNLFIVYFFFASTQEHEHWTIFFILVFSASEASIGLALLVYLSRSWGEMLKISKFN